jgi:hypothetical protein
VILDDGGSGDDQMASIMPPVDDGSGGGGGGGGIGEIPSDELALNYLQNPYYAYSGFGNQYNPYGFAQRHAGGFAANTRHDAATTG